ncbi:MAG: PEGA domain-containing protein, partial [Candidatus Thermoplasmatota archaeon]|nr:PEGA domain-containing protein [Candidatus Thermoplasmatota archaeon]
GRGPAATSGSSIIFSVGNGTYDYVVQRAGSYVPSQSTGAVTVNGKSETVTVSFAILDGYLVGSIKPSEATLVINGTSYFITNGSFNISLKPGNYSVVLSAAGYVTYTANVTITPLNVTHLQTNGLVKESKTGFIIEVIIFLLLMTGAIGSMILSRRRR